MESQISCEPSSRSGDLHNKVENEKHKHTNDKLWMAQIFHIIANVCKKSGFSLDFKSTNQPMC